MPSRTRKRGSAPPPPIKRSHFFNRRRPPSGPALQRADRAPAAAHAPLGGSGRDRLGAALDPTPASPPAQRPRAAAAPGRRCTSNSRPRSLRTNTAHSQPLGHSRKGSREHSLPCRSEQPSRSGRESTDDATHQPPRETCSRLPSRLHAGGDVKAYSSEAIHPASR